MNKNQACEFHEANALAKLYSNEIHRNMEIIRNKTIFQSFSTLRSQLSTFHYFGPVFRLIFSIPDLEMGLLVQQPVAAADPGCYPPDHLIRGNLRPAK